METFFIIAIVVLFAWLGRLTFIVGRIDAFLRDGELCDDCRGKEAATVSAAERADDDF